MSERKSVESIIKEEFISIVNNTEDNSSLHYNFKDLILIVSKRDGYVSINGSEIKHVDDDDYNTWLNELAEKAFRECVQVFIDKVTDEGHNWLHWGFLNSAWGSNNVESIIINNIKVSKEIDKVIEVLEFLNIDQDLSRNRFLVTPEEQSIPSYEEKFSRIIGYYGFTNVPFVEEQNVFSDCRNDRDILTIDGTAYTRSFLLECAAYQKLPFKLTKEMKRQIDNKECHIKSREDAIPHVNLAHTSEELALHRGLFGKCVVPSSRK